MCWTFSLQSQIKGKLGGVNLILTHPNFAFFGCPNEVDCSSVALLPTVAKLIPQKISYNTWCHVLLLEVFRYLIMGVIVISRCLSS